MWNFHEFPAIPATFLKESANDEDILQTSGAFKASGLQNEANISKSLKNWIDGHHEQMIS